MPIQRTTCFKLKDDADIAGMIEQYKVLEQTAEKVSSRVRHSTSSS